ncbi:hypothetical protein QJS83_15870 [Bdellovibrio sp. 22V]|uniref:hypothetical protein n=1 Tax=Bdellovibrio TaxID=958 RepID=UPI0025438191|nr:hypothetical protein [Bdellovibrio sp. 22V]WII71941.1 hypothetical protein QJS83_15870 [Bdellovibrio sp. 22V]
MTSRFCIFALASLLYFAVSAEAATVSAVKGQKVLINLEGDVVAPGDEFYLINPSSDKRTAIIRVKQVKSGKALAEIVKGRAASGYSLQAKAASPISADVPPPGSEEDTSTKRDASTHLRVLKDSYGVMGVITMNSMTADIRYLDSGTGILQTASATMNGNGFGVDGFYDYAFSRDFVGHAVAGIEQFNVSGSASSAACGGTTSCDAKINYLSFYGVIKWYLIQGKYRGWLGGGLGYLLAVSKSSSALNESQISTNQVFNANVGVDIQLNRRNYIPVSLEYNMFPSSDTVKASQMMIKAGWAWNL